MDNAKFHGGLFMAFSASETEFLRGATSGMMIAVLFSFVIFLFATQNIIQAIASVLSVAFIVTTVVSIMVFQGWQLGISESVGVVILIGFSVDYVVHLSSHYMHSAEKKRENRMQNAYYEMGGTILGGSITTLGSGIFLFFATVTLF